MGAYRRRLLERIQRCLALVEAARRIAPHAPEFAACMLCAQCMIRVTGSAEMVLRGRYHSGQPDPLVAERYARGGGQGCHDMPAAFAEVVAWINTQAEAAMGDVRGGMSTRPMCSGRSFGVVSA